MRGQKVPSERHQTFNCLYRSETSRDRLLEELLVHSKVAKIIGQSPRSMQVILDVDKLLGTRRMGVGCVERGPFRKKSCSCPSNELERR